MAYKRHRQPLEVMSAINVTNLLDTAFILLITFMLITPQLTQGVKIDLPDVDKSGSIGAEPSQAIQITIQKAAPGETQDWIFLKSSRGEETRVDLEELGREVEKAKTANAKVAVIINADTESRSGLFIQVIAAVKDAGIENVGLTTETPPAKPTLPSP